MSILYTWLDITPHVCATYGNGMLQQLRSSCSIPSLELNVANIGKRNMLHMNSDMTTLSVFNDTEFFSFGTDTTVDNSLFPGCQCLFFMCSSKVVECLHNC